MRASLPVIDWSEARPCLVSGEFDQQPSNSRGNSAVALPHRREITRMRVRNGNVAGVRRIEAPKEYNLACRIGMARQDFSFVEIVHDDEEIRSRDELCIEQSGTVRAQIQPILPCDSDHECIRRASRDGVQSGRSDAKFGKAGNYHRLVEQCLGVGAAQEVAVADRQERQGGGRRKHVRARPRPAAMPCETEVGRSCPRFQPAEVVEQLHSAARMCGAKD